MNLETAAYSSQKHCHNPQSTSKARRFAKGHAEGAEWWKRLGIQFYDIGWTVGLHNCLHFMCQGSNAKLVHPMSKKLRPWLNENALDRNKSDAMIL